MNEEVIAGYFPAMDSMPRGKTFKPSRALKSKYWFEATMTAVVMWLMVIIGFYGISYLVSLDEAWSHAAFIDQWFGFVNFILRKNM